MALTYMFLTQPNGSAYVTSPGNAPSQAMGRVYTANAYGLIVGVTPADASNLIGPGGATLTPIAATGLTADRPAGTVAASNFATAAINDIQPAPARGLPYYDTTLSQMIFFAGSAWVNALTGAAV